MLVLETDEGLIGADSTEDFGDFVGFFFGHEGGEFLDEDLFVDFPSLEAFFEPFGGEGDEFEAVVGGGSADVDEVGLAHAVDEAGDSAGGEEDSLAEAGHVEALVGGFFEREEDIVGFEGDASRFLEHPIGALVNGFGRVEESDPGVFVVLFEGHWRI